MKILEHIEEIKSVDLKETKKKRKSWFEENENRRVETINFLTKFISKSSAMEKGFRFRIEFP